MCSVLYAYILVYQEYDMYFVNGHHGITIYKTIPRNM